MMKTVLTEISRNKLSEVGCWNFERLVKCCGMAFVFHEQCFPAFEKDTIPQLPRRICPFQICSVSVMTKRWYDLRCRSHYTSTVWGIARKYLSHVMRKPVYAICSLISAFDVRCLDSIIRLLPIAEISRPWLVSPAEQAGLSLIWWGTPKTGFLMTWLILIEGDWCIITNRIFTVTPMDKLSVVIPGHCNEML